MKITGQLADKGFHDFAGDPQSHHGHLISRIWVVIADHQEAHIYRKVPDGLELIADAGPGSRNNEPFYGHFAEISEGRAKHDPDPREREKYNGDMVFIHSLAKWLDMADNEHVFDRLVLIADPHTLGSIRASLSDKVRERLTAELGKDLTKIPLKQIVEHLDRTIVF